MYHSLQLATPLDLGGVVHVIDALRSLPGVEGVDARYGATRVDVIFDENRTSPQELATALQRAGHPQRAMPHSHGHCCGSCGG
jgi:copper chaperone CopZ